MNEHKQSKFIIDVSAPAKRPNRSTTRFFSYDSHTAEIVIQAEKDGKLIDQALVDTVEIYFESVNLKYRPIDGLKWNDTMDISADGLYSYILPDDFLNYEGLVAFDVYINYKNGDKADSSNRIIFEQRVSAIDRAAGAVELVYIKDMEDAKQAVADKADEVMAGMAGYESSLADYEHQIKDGMDQLYDGVANASADEITKIREELPKVETAATEEITKIQAVLPDVQATAVDETAKIKAQLPIIESVAAAETEKIQAELPKVVFVTTDEITKIKAELPKVQTVATEEIGKIRDVLSTVENAAQEVSDHADQRIVEYDDKFVSTDQKMQDLEQHIDEQTEIFNNADVYNKAEIEDKLEPFALQTDIAEVTAQLAQTEKRKNEWLRSLGDAIYVAHKGFNGCMSGTTKNGVVPSNTHMSFELAGELGYKVIETDVQVLADGTWVVYHDKNTGTRLTGTDENVSDIDLSNFKSRTFYREYLSNGAWWTYTGDLTSCVPLTFEEFLLIAKKYGMYVMPEVKWSDTHTYTESDWENYANTVKKVGMEDRTIVFSAYSLWVEEIMKYLPNSIACASYDNGYFQSRIQKFKNHMLSVGSTAFTSEIETFCKENDIPINVWTVDDYRTAESLFKRGVKLITTNVLGSNFNLSEHSIILREMTNTLFSKSKTTKSDGDSSIDENNVIKVTTTIYNSLYLIIPANNLKRGDIIKLKATAKTNLADPSSVARIFINNCGTGTNKRESISTFTKNEYETKEIYYVVNDSSDDISVNFGITSANSVLSTGEFKDVEMTVYTKTDSLSLSNERFAMIYNYGTSGMLFRDYTARKGITNAYVDPEDSSLLCVDYEPFKLSNGNPLVFIQGTDYSTNLKYHVVPIVDNSTIGTVKLKVFDDSWVSVADVSSNLNLAFSILIKN